MFYLTKRKEKSQNGKIIVMCQVVQCTSVTFDFLAVMDVLPT